MDATTGGPAGAAREHRTERCGVPAAPAARTSLMLSRAATPRNASSQQPAASSQQPAKVQTKKKDLDYSKSFQDFCGGS